MFITSSYGLGEAVVQGAVNPDEFYVYKPALACRPAGDPQARRRRQGNQDDLRHARPRWPRPPQFVDVDQADRRLLSLSDA